MTSRNSYRFNHRPGIEIEQPYDQSWKGWAHITNHIIEKIHPFTEKHPCILLECYQGVELEPFLESLTKKLGQVQHISSAEAFKEEPLIKELTQPDVTDHRIFGKMSSLSIDDFLDQNKVAEIKEQIRLGQGIRVITGPGASRLVEDPEIWIYADMPRWELQLRMRKNQVNNLGVSNRYEPMESKYKRGYFVDWRVLDRLKIEQMDRWHLFLDTTDRMEPKLIEASSLFAGLDKAVSRPFSLVPFFDPGPWGGQWMKEKFSLDPKEENYAWCFNCVPEENSLLLHFKDTTVEIPSINLVFYHPKSLLGEHIFNEFGAEFPIRFDFLDTIEGGNLSLQVHPSKDYIKEQFGVSYTQDESYYMLEAEKDAFVYLGIDDDAVPDEQIAALHRAQESGKFDADKLSLKWPAKKHDHFLIPGGTIHCSGKGCMVLEISATPYIFTFKLWDWGRLGLDGRPRPISIDHGQKVIEWDRKRDWVSKELINRFEIIAEGEDWKEERTGLHESEFIETRRFTQNGTTQHNTNGTVNVLMVVEGSGVVVESDSGKFDPFVANYGEAFIIPAAVGQYKIRTLKERENILFLKAFVREEL